MERPNLVACIVHAAGRGQDQWTLQLTVAIASLLSIDGPWDIAAELHTAAVAAANRLGNNADVAAALSVLGGIEALKGHYVVSANSFGRR
jgi:hypothetical protein